MLPSLSEVLIVAVIVCGAAARITRLISADTITGPLRAWIMRRTMRPPAPGEEEPEGLSVSEFVACRWCMGFWVSCAVTALAWWVAGWPVTWTGLAAGVGLALTSSYVTGWLAGHEGD